MRLGIKLLQKSKVNEIVDLFHDDFKKEIKVKVYEANKMFTYTKPYGIPKEKIDLGGE